MLSNILYLLFRNLSKHLSFLIPAILDSEFKRCQIFCITRFATDIITSWLKEELAKAQNLVPHSVLVEKLTGDNTRAEKERVMKLFKEGLCQVLVCTDVAGMIFAFKHFNIKAKILPNFSR